MPAHREPGDVLHDVASSVLGHPVHRSIELLDVLEGAAHGPADVVRAGDDLLPRLAHENAMTAALSEAHRNLRPGGLLICAVPELDRLRRLRPTAPPPKVVQRPDGRQVTVQLWDWAQDGSNYGLDVVQLVQHQGGWEISQAVSTRHRVLTPEEMSSALMAAGFVGVQRLTPAESGHPLPVWLGLVPR
ncbi:hypothetical protein D5S17_20340 [Pseudonocardiaceae bacterium YIM PH 21723]|nr:hypothetical protein D5S17_20340 [Pseudonocardiaceae bacterium YIM PH 21723]